MYQSNYGYNNSAATPIAPSYRQTIVPQQPILKGRPVSSLEEARATTIDFDGSVFFFPDLANKRIYTKQINMDGTATLNMYELQKLPTAPTGGNYVTREEFEAVLQDLRRSLVPSSEQQVQTQPKPTTAPTAQSAVPQYNF